MKAQTVERTLLERAQTAEALLETMRAQNRRIGQQNWRLKKTIELLQPLGMDPAEKAWKQLTLRQLMLISLVMQNVPMKDMQIEATQGEPRMIGRDGVQGIFTTVYRILGVGNRNELYQLVLKSPRLAQAVAMARQHDEHWPE